MNSNLSDLERAARNLFAGTTGVTSKKIVEIAFDDPDIKREAEELAGAVLSGPYGSFEPVEDVIDYINNKLLGAPAEFEFVVGIDFTRAFGVPVLRVAT